MVNWYFYLRWGTVLAEVWERFLQVQQIIIKVCNYGWKLCGEGLIYVLIFRILYQLEKGFTTFITTWPMIFKSEVRTIAKMKRNKAKLEWGYRWILTRKNVWHGTVNQFSYQLIQYNLSNSCQYPRRHKVLCSWSLVLFG